MTTPAPTNAKVSRKAALLASVWLLCFLSFAGLGVRASTGHVLAVDLRLARWVQSGPSPVGWVADVANGVNEPLPLALFIALPAALLFYRRYRYEAFAVLGTLAVRALQDGAKYIFDEPRPAADLVRVSEHLTNPGYPSGHVVGTTTLFVLLLVFASLMLGRSGCVLRLFAVFMVASIPIARIWVGAHWPSDCLGGYLFASLYLIPVFAFRRRQDLPRCVKLALPWRGGSTR